MNRTRPSDSRIRCRRHASTYVAVLGVSMLVMTIGLSALMAVRIENKGSLASLDTAAARFYAQSAVDLGLFTIENDASWRTNATHNTWSANFGYDGADARFKLVDQVDTDLGDDPNDAVRLFGKGQYNDAVRNYSVLLQPQTPPNLLKNGDMEAARAAWACMGVFAGPYCDLESLIDTPRSGKSYLKVKNRDDYWCGPTQDIAKQIQDNTWYYAEAWVRMKDTPNNIKITMKVTASSGVSYYSTGWTAVSTSWIKVPGTIKPNWLGDLLSAYLYVEGDVGTPEFYVDDVMLVEGQDPPSAELTIVPGTWQREPAE